MSAPVEEEEVAEGRLFDPHLTGRLLRYTKPYLIQMGVGLFVLLLLTLATNMQPWLTKEAIENYLSADAAASLSLDERISSLRTICIYLGLFVLGSFLFRASQMYLMRWVGEHVIRDLRQEVFDKILALPVSYFNRVPVGRLMTRVTSDMDALQMFVTQGVVGVISSLLMLIGVMFFMLKTDRNTALIVFLIIPIMLSIMTWINSHARRAYRDVRGKQSGLNTYLQESITGMSTIQSLTRETDVHEDFDRQNQSLFLATKHSIKVWSYYFPAMEVLNLVAMTIILTAAGLQVLAHGAAAVGVLFAFAMYIREFFRPIEELADKSNVFQNAMASSERIFALLDEPLEVEDSPNAVPVEHFRGDVEFQNVHFAYIDDQWILKDISFKVEAGKSLALVGATGAGKTSIISLVSRFYDVQQGAVLVDGKNVRDYEQSSLRRHVGVVLQDPFIFTGSVAENIAMHNPDVPRDTIVEAAKHVNAHRFITELADGYDTQLGERGSNLSTGQKQLLALARALVQNPDIVLVLDEATANVDTETEQLIQEALHKVMHERTSIIIAHRLSTIKDVDQILVMKHGEIIERGNHQELIAEAGYYHTLYELLSHAPQGT